MKNVKVALKGKQIKDKTYCWQVLSNMVLKIYTNSSLSPLRILYQASIFPVHHTFRSNISHVKSDKCTKNAGVGGQMMRRIIVVYCYMMILRDLNGEILLYNAFQEKQKMLNSRIAVVGIMYK